MKLFCAACMENYTAIDAYTMIEGTALCFDHAREYIANKAVKDIQLKNAMASISKQMEDRPDM